MKIRILQAGIVLGVVLVAMGALAPKASAQAYKIGIVDMDKLREGHAWYQKQYKDLQDLVDKLEGEIAPVQKKIDEMTKDYEAKRDTLDSIARLKAENAIREMAAEYQNGWKERQAAIDEKEIAVNKEWYADVAAVVKQLGAEQNYHLILQYHADPRDQVLYFATAIDVTSEVLVRLNKMDKSKK